jgi:hypothetical protein
VNLRYFPLFIKYGGSAPNKVLSITAGSSRLTAVGSNIAEVGWALGFQAASRSGVSSPHSFFFESHVHVLIFLLPAAKSILN